MAYTLGVYYDYGLKGIWWGKNIIYNEYNLFKGYGTCVAVLSVILGIKLVFFTSLDERAAAI